MQLSNEALDSFSWDCSLDAQSLERLVVVVIEEVEKLVSINLTLSKQHTSAIVLLFDCILFCRFSCQHNPRREEI